MMSITIPTFALVFIKNAIKMKGKFQGQDETVVNASVNKIWDVLIDGTLLPKWMPMVKNTNSITEALNEVRFCEVEIKGNKGKVSEKCVLYNEKKEIGWMMLSDEFGFDKMFDNFGFSFELTPIDKNSTKVIGKGYADPKNIFAQFIILITMRRMSSNIRKQALSGIKKIAES